MIQQYGLSSLNLYTQNQRAHGRCYVQARCARVFSCSRWTIDVASQGVVCASKAADFTHTYPLGTSCLFDDSVII